ncbi:MAG: hypothetical protein WB817_00410 [Terriglobales bacterium]
MPNIAQRALSAIQADLFPYSWWGALPQAILLACCIDVYRGVYTVPPGVAVGVLGFVAAYMAIRTEHRWSRWEKAIWVGLAFWLLVIELNSIYTERGDFEVKRLRAEAEEQLARKEEHESFRKLVDNGQTIFDDQKRIAKDTKDVLTGGDSYVVITISNPSGGGDVLPLVAQICPRCKHKNSIPNTTINLARTKPNPAPSVVIFQQTVDPTYSTFSTQTISPQRGVENEYKIVVMARNAPTVEYLTVRFNVEKNYWEFKYRVLREIRQSHWNPQTKLAEGEVLKTLVSEPWGSATMTHLNEKTIEVQH